MMSHRVSIKYKRVIAWLLIVCLLLSNCPLAGLEVRAEGTQTSTTIACTITPKVKVGGIEYTIPDSYISVKDSNNNEVALKNNKYDLIANANYTCVIKGAEMAEHTVAFTAPENAGAIVVMGDAQKIQLVYNDLDSFYVGETRTPVNDLKIEWTWKSEDSSFLEVDTNGVITGNKNGTKTITRTSKTASESDEAVTNTVSINVIGQSNYTLNYKYGNQELSGDKEIEITIKDSSNQTVKQGEDSQYTFIWGETYTYSIAEKNGVTSTSGTFKPEKDETSVDIPVELVLPVFKLEGKDLSENTTKVKSGEENIAIACDNVSSLYDSANWKIQINSDEKKAVDSTDIVFNTKNSVQIKYYYGDKLTKTYSVNRFLAYKVNYWYDGETITSEEAEFKDSVEVSQWKANNTYILESMTAQGLEFIPPDPNTYKVETKYTEESYDIYLESKDVKVTTPQIYVAGKTPNAAGEYEFTYGEQIEVKLDDVSTYLNGGETGWQWSCQNGSSSLSGSTQTTGDIMTYTLDLQGKTEGVYTLKYTFGEGQVSSNEIKIRIKKIKLYATKLPTIEKAYDGNNEFIYDKDSEDVVDKFLTLGSGYFKDQDGNTVSYNNDITLKCTVDGSDVGDYTKIQIKEVIISDSSDIAGDAFDVSGLVDKEGGYSVNVARIKKAEGVKLNINKLWLYYMDQTGDPVNSDFNEDGSDLYEVPIDKSLKQVIFNHLGKIKVVDEVKKTYSVDEDKLSFDNKNISCTITVGTTFQYSSQILDVSRSMQNKIDISQQQFGKTVTVNGTNNWINANELQAAFNQADNSEFDTYYDNITYKELTCENGVIKVDDNISGDTGVLTLPQERDENMYYGIILSKDGKYKTIALVVRIVAEKNKDDEYQTTIKGDNDVTYSVVNLYLDDSKDEVVFEESVGGADTEGLDYSSLEKKKDYKEKGESIAFEIQNIVSEIYAVRYGFAKFTGKKPDVNSINWKNAQKKASQSVELDLEDGTYVMYVEVTDTVGNQSTYVTNGFVVDNKPPQLQFLLNNKEITEKELAERIYKKEDQNVTINVVEDNIATVEAKVSATNRKGESVLTEDELQQMEEKIETALKENNTYVLDTAVDANYTIHVKVVDANDKFDEANYMFTIDKSAPETGEVKITGFFDEIVENADKEDGIITTKRTEFEKTWNSFVERIYEIFAKDTVTVTLSAEDKMTDVEISYLMTDKEYTEEQLNDMEDSKWTAYDPDNKPQTQVNQREYVYMKVEDKAGNESYFNSKGIITDAVAPSIDAQLSKEANANNFYNGDVKISVNVSELTASTQAGASGLKYVGYRVESNGEVTEAKAVIGKSTSETEKSFDINLDAQKHNKNDIKVYITAVDNAGNRNVTEPINLKIDSVKPEISVTYNDESGSEYYNHTRTATIVIKERNLNTKDVEINIKSEHGSKASVGKWTHTDNIGKSDDAVYTCQVTFDADDDYEFSVDCVDKAGNKANEAFSDKFTVDKTIPVINVSYSNGQMEQNGYYNEAVTATITIEEHNFEAGKADVRISSEEGTVVSSGFSNHGDTHTASVVFDRDGTYSLQVSFTDEAGNEAEAYQGNTFNIDLKNPEIVISNVKDKSANKDDVIPVITCTDRNYDANRVSVTIQGSNSGEIGLDKLGLETRAVANGEEFSLTFPKEEAMDDVYTLTAKVVDKAGNETEESIQFSVNRYGSVYTLGTETGEWLSSDECAYIKESKPVVIIETNVDEVVERNIAYTVGEINAETVKVKEMADCSAEEKSNGAYYESREISTGNDWYQYQYTVAAENFTKEGNYRIQIDSVDKAGNHVSNVSNNHSESKLEIAFAVDQTAPSAVVSGTENGGIYSGSSHTVLLSVEDNMALNTVSVYLNGNEYATYDAKEILELEDGMIPVEVEESLSTQTIQLKATDMAGNVLGKDADGKYDAEFEDFKLLVTSNRLAQMLHSYWIFIILAIVTAGIVIAVVILKRKRKKVSE